MENGKGIGIETLEVHGTSRDVLTEILRKGAVKLLSSALSMEVEALLAEYHSLRLTDGKQQVVRNGYHKERTVQTGIGDVSVCVPRVVDRGKSGIVYESLIVPKYLRRSQSVEEVVPWLYLKGISTGNFREALHALLGEGAKGLSAATISRLKSVWVEEYHGWEKRDLSDKQYAYFWVDGVHMNTRLSEAKQCILVIMGCDLDGNKELIGISDGYAESAASWKELLLALKEQGLSADPQLVVGDGALGFWKAASEVYGKTKQQRCWKHKTENVLDKLPKSLRPQAKRKIHDIWMTPGKEEAGKAFDHFLQVYRAKYPKATECLEKDREQLLTFYDFPAEHWKHIRTTNPIESVFSAVRLRTGKTRGCLSRETGLAMVFKLCHSAQHRWRRIHEAKLLKEVMDNIVFIDGVRENAREAA